MKTSKEVELDLICDLTPRELEYRAQELGAAVVEQDELMTAKREAAKVYTEQMDGLAQRMRLLSKAIRTKVERRLVRCVVTFHSPREGYKCTARLDTGEVVPGRGEEQMTMDECQQHLFEAGAGVSE